MNMIFLSFTWGYTREFNLNKKWDSHHLVIPSNFATIKNHEFCIYRVLQ
jgi:hypothetical protein